MSSVKSRLDAVAPVFVPGQAWSCRTMPVSSESKHKMTTTSWSSIVRSACTSLSPDIEQHDTSATSLSVRNDCTVALSPPSKILEKTYAQAVLSMSKQTPASTSSISPPRTEGLKSDEEKVTAGKCHSTPPTTVRGHVAERSISKPMSDMKGRCGIWEDGQLQSKRRAWL